MVTPIWYFWSTKLRHQVPSNESNPPPTTGTSYRNNPLHWWTVTHSPCPVTETDKHQPRSYNVRLRTCTCLLCTIPGCLSLSIPSELFGLETYVMRYRGYEVWVFVSYFRKDRNSYTRIWDRLVTDVSVSPLRSFRCKFVFWFFIFLLLDSVVTDVWQSLCLKCLNRVRLLIRFFLFLFDHCC